MEKGKKKTIITVGLILIILVLIGYIIYDKSVTNGTIDDLNKQISSLKEENKNLAENNSKESSNIGATENNNIVGGYIGTVDAPAEIGRPTETNELLIQDDKNAIFCFNVGNGTTCYKGTYIINDNTLYLHSIDKKSLDLDTIVSNGSDNSYMSFSLAQNQITYNGEADGSLVGTMTKTETSNFKYVKYMQ